MDKDNKKMTTILLERIDVLVSYIDSFKKKNLYNKLDNWLDNQDVCQILNISPRTLQFYRDSGKLPYSRIEKKIYYRREDVFNLLNNKT